MCGLIAAEAALFTIFVVAYLYYLGKSATGPTPQDVLHAPILLTICLLSSSATIHFAVKALGRGRMAPFLLGWLLTIVLGTIFLVGTGFEWRHLIYDENLTIRTNLFGTTYYSLVGLHAFHVTVGLIALLIALATVSILSTLGRLTPGHAETVEALSLYWHFVDVVWVVVFTVVYVIGR
jgi:cytochrome c oxidase subunit 3/cytochrome o ubiquinol oxidase subunit 3